MRWPFRTIKALPAKVAAGKRAPQERAQNAVNELQRTFARIIELQRDISSNVEKSKINKRSTPQRERAMIRRL
jgi:hypothetical protein